MPTIGPVELILILVAVIIVFGVGKLPEVGGAVGKSIREFRKSSREAMDDEEEDGKDADSDKSSADVKVETKTESKAKAKSEA